MQTLHNRRPRMAWLALLLGAVTVVLAGCAVSPAPTASLAGAVAGAPAGPKAASEVLIHENLTFATANGQPLTLDLCEPKQAKDVPDLRPAIVAVHGGSWTYGDKADRAWRGICQWLASEGFVAASVGYRLSPAAVYPAAIDDVASAVRWLRDPAQDARYRIDPKRIGALGGSAGGNLVSLLAARGSGPLDVGTRVAAVAELSAPVDLTETGVEHATFRKFILSYLGCAGWKDCPQAQDASATSHIDATDPPFFIAHSTREFIPIEQARELVQDLDAAHVSNTFIEVPGHRHAVDMLDSDLRSRIIRFFRSVLAAPGSAKTLAGALDPQAPTP
ncbi:MAG: alpha/beta hydrolase [Frankiales bacterium]|nr:alpha/beta hydrolase [Frankiales bacterium]